VKSVLLAAPPAIAGTAAAAAGNPALARLPRQAPGDSEGAQAGPRRESAATGEDH
jgi:hypothetical protein